MGVIPRHRTEMMQRQNGKSGRCLTIALICLYLLQSEAIEMPGSIDGPLSPEAHAQTYNNPTCMELMKYNRWRSWARRQVVDIGFAPSLIRICCVCLTNTESSKIAETHVKSFIASNGLHHRLTVESRGAGGGRKDWFLPNGWSSFHGKEPEPALTEVAAEFRLWLSGNARPINPECIQDSDQILCYGKEAHDELLRAASHWEKAGLVHDYKGKIRLMPGIRDAAHVEAEWNPAALKWKEGDSKEKAREAIEAFLEDSKLFLESLNLTKS
ncbi:hypothetical protein GUITHDRAFT_133401 [Guillardia theta CCMP2712]|uniref:Uncharacterized protein n=1 Tax=Guillardia theta (strain CCMP2712) TaxID=905079 RepID=L1JY39_GUITC|nr:hypothetical protein GUITHDRAFT_133401 [Guillardia theta CCMP2712]EKX53013.1 hypothetical protein GUITHDRAFT_133401 [Guillardia theta CCMP2712]|eukprot:XP_005839993.1 hypothetical protein GUITHDRAFT_133401 [Guillardia theta CCMP2712]